MPQGTSQDERSRDLRLAALALIVLGMASACGNNRGAPLDDTDAGFDAPLASDAAVDGSPALSVDFVAEGCSSGGSRGASCRGQAPLSVVFAPVLTGEFSRFFWDFGDGSPPSALETPAHVYDTPGRYDVGLVVGGPAGSLSRTHAAFVVVSPAAAGAACVRDGQCGPGLHCLCANASDGCGPAFTQGICTRACLGTPNASVDAEVMANGDAGLDAGPPGIDDCGPRAVCADLSVGGAGKSTPPAPWQTPLCLTHCAKNADCPVGLSCRRLPGGPASAGDWTLACFPSAPRDLGAPCRDANGVLDDSACVGGLCADLGAFGLCSADCTTAPCPLGSPCAAFPDGRHLCLPACSSLAPDGGAVSGTSADGGHRDDAGSAAAANACASDPLLSCVAPGPRGPLGFSLANDGGAGARVCGPRPCTTDSDCAPSGRCLSGDAAEGACAWPRSTGLSTTDAGLGRDEGATSPPDATSDATSSDGQKSDAPFGEAGSSDSAVLPLDGALEVAPPDGGGDGSGGTTGDAGNAGHGGSAGSASDAGAQDLPSVYDGGGPSSGDALVDAVSGLPLAQD